MDVAVTAPVVHAFYAAAVHDPRFKKRAMGKWEYTSSSGIIRVPLARRRFCAHHKGGKGDCGGRGMRARLGELAIMKAGTWLARYDEKDLEDFKFLLTKMEEMGGILGSRSLGMERRWEIQLVWPTDLPSIGLGERENLPLLLTPASMPGALPTISEEPERPTRKPKSKPMPAVPESEGSKKRKSGGGKKASAPGGSAGFQGPYVTSESPIPAPGSLASSAGPSGSGLPRSQSSFVTSPISI